MKGLICCYFLQIFKQRLRRLYKAEFRVPVVLISTLPKNQAASIEMVISDFFRIPKTLIAFVSLCHKSPKAKGKL